MSMLEIMPILREGVWLYAGVSPVRVRMLGSSETWGSGDYVDEETIAENQSIPCFFIS